MQVMNSGKHKGETFDYIFNNDRNYVWWLVERNAPHASEIIEYVRTREALQSWEYFAELITDPKLKKYFTRAFFDKVVTRTNAGIGLRCAASGASATLRKGLPNNRLRREMTTFIVETILRSMPNSDTDEFFDEKISPWLDAVEAFKN